MARPSSSLGWYAPASPPDSPASPPPIEDQLGRDHWDQTHLPRLSPITTAAGHCSAPEVSPVVSPQSPPLRPRAPSPRFRLSADGTLRQVSPVGPRPLRSNSLSSLRPPSTRCKVNVPQRSASAPRLPSQQSSFATEPPEDDQEPCGKEIDGPPPDDDIMALMGFAPVETIGNENPESPPPLLSPTPVGTIDGALFLPKRGKTVLRRKRSHQVPSASAGKLRCRRASGSPGDGENQLEDPFVHPGDTHPQPPSTAHCVKPLPLTAVEQEAKEIDTLSQGLRKLDTMIEARRLKYPLRPRSMKRKLAESEFIMIISAFLAERHQLATLAPLLQLNSDAYDMASLRLYATVHVTTTNAAAFFRTLMPPPPSTSKSQRSSPTRNGSRIDPRKPYHIIYDSLPPYAPSSLALIDTKYVVAPIRKTYKVAVMSGAWEGINKSYLLAHTVRDFASPSEACLDISDEDTGGGRWMSAKALALRKMAHSVVQRDKEPSEKVRLACFNLTRIILPGWNNLHDLTIHHPEILLSDEKTRLSLFEKEIQYHLVFRVDTATSATSATLRNQSAYSTHLSRDSDPKDSPTPERADATPVWGIVMPLLRSLQPLQRSIEVVIPHDSHGTLRPRGHDSVPRSELCGVVRALVGTRNANMKFVCIEDKGRACWCCS